MSVSLASLRPVSDTHLDVYKRQVLDLALPGRKSIPPFLVQEDDGLFFVDYLGLTKNKRRKHLHNVVAGIVLRLLTSPEPSVREKGRWLADYSDAVLSLMHI